MIVGSPDLNPSACNGVLVRPPTYTTAKFLNVAAFVLFQISTCMRVKSKLVPEKYTKSERACKHISLKHFIHISNLLVDLELSSEQPDKYKSHSDISSAGDVWRQYFVTTHQLTLSGMGVWGLGHWGVQP